MGRAPSRTPAGAAVLDLRSRWRALGEPLETTLQGVELALVRAFSGLRLVNLVQLSLAVQGLLARSPRPALDLVLTAAFTLETIAVIGIGLRRRSLNYPRLVWADVTFGVLVLAGQLLVSDPGNRLGTWDAWGYAVTLSCALLVGMTLPTWQAVLATGVLSTAYLVVTLEGAHGQGQQWTAATNCLGYAAFALIGGATSGFLRRLGRDADNARALAAQAGAEAEMERHRRLLHDHAALLSMIGTNAGGDQLQDALRRQAAAAAHTVSSFLASSPTTAAEPSLWLAELLRQTTAQFPDLPITLNVDLAEQVHLTPTVARTISAAVATLLHNVRVHSSATSCTVHADASESGGAWEVSVRDDGVGFDTSSTLPGFGLARQVRAAAAEAGVAVSIDTAPGMGTMVTLSAGQLRPTGEPFAARRGPLVRWPW